MPIETLQLTEGSGETMSSSEGGREIQLAKERLVSAKARAESASKTFAAAKETKKQVAKTMENAKSHEECASKQLVKAKEATKQAEKTMETATRGVNTAQLELLLSQNEVKKATESFKAAEKRQEVVTIDSDDDKEEGNSKKKVKVSTEEEAKGDDTNDEENNVNQIVVMGCGSSKVNGVYVKETTPSGRKIFVKLDMLTGSQGAFVIDTGGHGWVITSWPDSNSSHKTERGQRKKRLHITGSKTIQMYRVLTDSHSFSFSQPPENGWVAANGTNPPPTLQLQNA